jgi:hypothetical protein
MRKAQIAKLCLVLLAVVSMGTASINAQNDTSKCGGSTIANGPFSYSSLSISSTTFSGTAGAPVSTGFTVYAPNASGSNVVFPGQGQNACLGSADASILALEVVQVEDASGTSIDPVDVTDSAIGQQIISAFTLTPNTNTFTPGSSAVVNVTVNNPNVASTAYGVYQVKLAAQAPGAGIGVGPGPIFTLTLSAPSASDITPPSVTINAPSGNLLLGVIPVKVTANDPAPGSGVASITATVSSAGGMVSNVSACSQTYSGNSAGTPVICNGSFTPIAGGVGDSTGPFTSASPSGIGNYTLNAQATDNAGNTGYASQPFSVNYDLSDLSAAPSGSCKTTANCTGVVTFTAKRGGPTADGASDGKAMNDETVVVKLCLTTDSTCASPVTTHPFGTGDVKLVTQINVTTFQYQTHFAGITPGTSYFVQVWFTTVDGQSMLQATSPSFVGTF